MRITTILCTIALLGLVASGGGSKATTPDPAPPGLETSTITLSGSDSDGNQEATREKISVQTDTDQDGLSDEFEDSIGLDPTNSSDAFNDEDGDGAVTVDELLTFHTEPEQAPVPTPAVEKRLYLGFWEPGLNGSIAGELEHLKSLGVNTMSVVPSYRPLPDGTFSTRPGNKQMVISQIVEAHEKGIQVYLVPTFWNPIRISRPQ